MQNMWIIGAVYVVLFFAGIAIDIVIVRRLSTSPFPWQARAVTLAARPWRWRDLLRLLAIVWVLHLTVLFGAHVFGATDGEDVAAVWYLAQSIAFHWAALVFTIAVTTKRHVSWKRAFGIEGFRSWSRTKEGVFCYVATIPVLVFYTVIYQVWLRVTGHMSSQQDVIEVFMTVDSLGVRVYLIFLAVVLAPVLEEIVFRGIALPVLVRQWGLAPAVVVTSAMFALIHLHLPSLVPLFIMSVAFSLAYYFSQSLLVPMVMHALFNGVNIGLLALVRHLSENN